MPQFDQPLADLERYLPDREEPADFDAFWDTTLNEQRAYRADPHFEEVHAGYTQLVTEDVTFAGYDGQPIKGWLLRPRRVQGPLPTVVTYIGYGGGRSLLSEWTALPSAGYAHFVMDLRGQGAGYRVGQTADGPLNAPHVGGFLTLGISDPHTYYYRRLYIDAVNAIGAVQAHPAVDPARVVLCGTSQGGGLTLAATGLAQRIYGRAPIGAISNVPFLSHIRHATEIVATPPYSELVTYLGVHRNQVENVFRTLSYFDGVNFAARGTIPALFSVGLLDATCPPSCVFAAYNHYAGPKEIKVYPYNGHEHGGPYQEAEHLTFLAGIPGNTGPAT